MVNIRNVVTSHREPGFNYGYLNSPFIEFDYARQATFLVYNGRLMPISFRDSSRIDDYWCLRKKAAMYPTGELPTEIKGRDAEQLCNKIFTKDITKLNVGRCTYGIACYPDGGMIVDGILMRLEKERFWFVQAEGQIYSWLIAKAEGLDVEISDPNVWVNQVQGPLSLDILKAACDTLHPEPFRYFDIAKVTMAGQSVIITRTGFTAEIGWEYYVSPGTDCTRLWKHLMKIGKEYGLIHSGLDSMDIRRIEAGIMNAGSDFDKTMNPFQTGLGKFVDIDKDDFIGKAALEVADKNKLVFGLLCETSEPMVLGAAFANSKRIGIITAAAWSPYLGNGIGYIRLTESGYRLNEKEIEIDGIDGTTHPAKIVELPFYDVDKKIPRGLTKLKISN